MMIFSNKNNCFHLLLMIPIIFIISITQTCIAETKNNIIRIATTSSTVNSGLIKILEPAFESKYPYKLEVSVSGSGNALRRARTGKVDLTITHSPLTEEKLIKDGYGIERHLLMKNEFILAGPLNDPANITKSENIITALKSIALQQASFISRGDDSGTHKKELYIWEMANIEPYGNWYIETGSGMGEALREADKQQSYILTDNGTWLALRKKLNLKTIVTGDERLSNPYSIIIVSPVKYPQVNHKGAKVFFDWILSPAGQQIIRDFKIDGMQLFTPYN